MAGLVYLAYLVYWAYWVSCVLLPARRGEVNIFEKLLGVSAEQDLIDFA